MGVRRVLRVIIPGLPPRECSPNARPHYMAKAGETKLYRHEVGWQAIAAKDGKAWLAPDKARVDVTFIVPDRRRRDKTNFASAFKAGLDGLVDAGVIVDDSYEHIDDQYHIVYEKGKSMTIVEVSSEA